ncbi:uncharacterized protein [Rutidosis leptorrhynchoides]|uniref:uncharacterized protein n=1 Tax=Rutidosis leptorrhynchoides TaxID=125765 RepID=UPI003A99DD4F
MIFGAVTSTVHRMMKFPTPAGVTMLYAERKRAIKCVQIYRTTVKPIIHDDGSVSPNPAFPDQKLIIDAYKGYHQIPMVVRNQDKTAFHTADGIFSYVKMPFGLKNAGATYQHVIDMAFRDQIGRNVEAYVDDIVIKSDTEESMLRDILVTFESLRKINMKLNPKKCTFGVEEGKFSGHVVTERGIKANLKKIQAIEDMTSPKTKKEVQSLNRRLAALTRFLSRAAERLLPFMKVLNSCLNKKKFVWTAKVEAAFQDVKQLLKELPTLTAPIAGETLILYMALSAEAINTLYANIFYFLLETTEKVDYPQKAKTNNRIWELHTDGASSEEGVGAGFVLTNPEGEEHTYALKFCFYASNNEAEYEAFLSGLRREFEIGIKHLRAYVDSHIVAQQVNRAFEAEDVSMKRYLQFVKKVLVEVLKEKSIDEKVVIATVEEGGECSMTPYVKKSYNGPNLRCLAPQQAVDVVKEMHEGFCAQHSGYRTIVARIMRNNHVMHWNHFPGVLEMQDFWWLQLIFFFTKWVEAKVLTWITGENMKIFVWNDIVCGYGLPNEIVSDNGKQFAENPFKSWCEELSIKQTFIYVTHPQANGQVEVTNKEIVAGIKARLGLS